MNDAAANWQEGNTRYLSAALLWLRACLEYRASQLPDPAQHLLPAAQTAEESRSFWRNFMKGTQRSSNMLPKLLPAHTNSKTDALVTEAAEAMQKAAEEMNPPPALLILAKRLGLSEFERQLLLLCLAMELDPGIAALCARCQNDSVRPCPTFALAFSLFENPSWDALSPERPLRYWRLIEINQPGGQALTVSQLRADERIVNYLKGLNYLDDRLAPILIPIDAHRGPSDLPPSHRGNVETILRRLKQVEAGRSLPVIQLLGSDSASKQLAASDVAGSIGLHLYRLPAAFLPSQAGELETLARLWQRESLLLPLALYIDASEAPAAPAAHGQGPPITRLLERIDAAVLLHPRHSGPGLVRWSIPFASASAHP